MIPTYIDTPPPQVSRCRVLIKSLAVPPSGGVVGLCSLPEVSEEAEYAIISFGPSHRRHSEDVNTQHPGSIAWQSGPLNNTTSQWFTCPERPGVLPTNPFAAESHRLISGRSMNWQGKAQVKNGSLQQEKREEKTWKFSQEECNAGFSKRLIKTWGCLKTREVDIWVWTQSSVNCV